MHPTFSGNASPPRSYPPEAENLLEEFEVAWQGGQIPDLARFALAACVPTGILRRHFLEDLVSMDLEFRWRQNPTSGHRLEDYLATVPDLAPLDQLSVECIGTEYWVRHRWGDRPGHDEYHRRFPGHAAALTPLLQHLDARLAHSRYPGATRANRGPVGNSVTAAPPVTPPPEAAELLVMLREGSFLEAEQLADAETLAADADQDARALATELVRRNWLTSFQADALLRGRGNELRIGDYVLLEQLGEGGVGRVYRAHDPRLQQQVALKVIREELMADPEVVARFKREIRVVRQLSHPNIVRGLEADAAGTAQVLAVEYVTGTDLGKLVRQQGPRSMAEACDYIRQAALGLQYAHERGLVHRDLKPSNILLEKKEATGFGCARIADFGLARLRQPLSDGDATQLRRDNTGLSLLTPQGAFMIGTPDYMAPEQAEDFHNADIRADIYSLGCTLYFLLTGQPPFPGGSLAEKLARHMRRTPTPLAAFRADVPAAVQQVLDRMLAKHPDERFQTPGEVAAALGDPAVLASTLLAFQPSTMLAVGKESGERPTQERDRQHFLSRRRVLITAATVLSGLAGWKWAGGKQEISGVTEEGHPPQNLPGVDEAWLAHVRRLPANDQVKEVREMLVKLNPDFDGNLTPQFNAKGNVVIGLSFETNQVTDISPVGAVAELQRLDCSGKHPDSGGVPVQGSLADLRPLRGLKLRGLNCGYSKVRDLSGLADMPLTELHVFFSEVEDLAPIAKAPLQGISVNGTKVSDLSPLKNGKLWRVYFSQTNVKTLKPLEGMPLRSVDCSFTAVDSLHPLRDMLLTHLYCGHTKVTDLKPLASVGSLFKLEFQETEVDDLTPLANLQKLERLVFDSAMKVKSLDKLRNLRLTHLSFSGCTDINDLSPVCPVNLQGLNCSRTRVEDLNPLKKMKKLKSLRCHLTKITDLSPLLEVPTLEYLFADPQTIANNRRTLQKHPGLKNIYNMPAKLFWEKVDKGELP